MQTTIKSLHKKGYSNAYIARTLGVSRNTVGKVIKSEERGKEQLVKKLHPILTDELERYFRETVELLAGDKEAWIDYDLTEDGPFLVLQPEIDNLYNLGDYGLTQEYGGLLSATPEFASMEDEKLWC